MNRRDNGATNVRIIDMKQDGTAEESRKAIKRYVLRLLAAVLFFTVLSYLIQDRGGGQTNARYYENPSDEQRIESLREEYDELKTKYDELRILYDNLTDQIGTEVEIND